MSTVDIDELVINGMPVKELLTLMAELFATQKSTLKAELLAKMPKKRTIPPYNEINEQNYVAVNRAKGHNQAITEITKLLEEL